MAFLSLESMDECVGGVEMCGQDNKVCGLQVGIVFEASLKRLKFCVSHVLYDMYRGLQMTKWHHSVVC